MQKLDHRFGDDGAFWMSYEDLLKKFQTFDRTRLFTEDWKVTQQWVSLDVLWTVDYHDTKFSFSLEKKAPVVIVLSQVRSPPRSKALKSPTLFQLDKRYFCGLEGQYQFKISFRVHKAGDVDSIVRSHGNYWMRRSVTAELELEAGEYHVLMKVEAVKDSESLPVEEVVRNNVKTRRDKLLRIGLAYDLAHAKVQMSDSDEDKKARKKAEAKTKAKEKKEMKEKLMKEKKKRKHNENKEIRKTRAAAAKRKAKAKAVEERKIAEKGEKAAKEKEAKQEDAKEELKDTAVVSTEIPEKSESQAKLDEQKTETTTTEPVTVKDGKAAPVVQEAKTPRPLPQPGGEKPAVDQPPTTTTTADKPAELDTEEKVPTSGSLAGLLGFRVKATVHGPSSISGFSDIDDDDDDLSELNSVVSDITSGELEDEIAAAKVVDRALVTPATPADDEEDEFERDPWNAVVVVGLRVYSKESGVSVKVVRPRDTGGKGKDEKVEVEWRWRRSWMLMTVLLMRQRMRGTKGRRKNPRLTRKRL